MERRYKANEIIAQRNKIRPTDIKGGVTLVEANNDIAKANGIIAERNKLRVEDILVGVSYTEANEIEGTSIEPEEKEAEDEEGLTEALSEVKDGDIIKLSSDIQVSNDLAIDKSITLNMNGKELSLGDKAFTIKSEVTIKDGKVLSNNRNVAIDVKNGKLTLDNAEVVSTSLYGINLVDDSELVVNSGRITSKDSCIASNNTTTNFSTITINGGDLTSESDATIYLPAPGIITINGGTLNGGINARMGNIIVNGGTINSIQSGNDLIEDYYNYSGNVWLGDAIACMAGTYTSKSEEHDNSLNIELNGGNINCLCDGCSAVTVYNLGVVEQNISVKISKEANLTVKDESQPIYKVVQAIDIVPEDANDYAKYTSVVNTVTEIIE